MIRRLLLTPLAPIHWRTLAGAICVVLSVASPFLVPYALGDTQSTYGGLLRLFASGLAVLFFSVAGITILLPHVSSDRLERMDRVAALTVLVLNGLPVLYFLVAVLFS